MYVRKLGALLATAGAFGTSSFYIADGVSGESPAAGPVTPTGTDAAVLLREGGGEMTTGGRCGRERWAVKTLTDPGASDINLKPIPTTITALGSIPAPESEHDLPRQAQEKNVYTVKGTIVGFKKEDDNDIHLAIADPAPGPHPTMIAEFPASFCATGAVDEVQLGQARTAFEAAYGKPSSKFKTPTGCVTLTGVFFFDKIHGQLGVAPNGAELHPVIDFQNECGANPAAPPSPTGPTTASCTYRDLGALPDPACTPGALNPDVTPATIGSTICKKGWTKTVRPPSSVTGRQKRVSMKQYGVGDNSPGDFEYDHLISLELGGAPDDLKNLWPEPHVVSGDDGSFAKDKIENRLKRAICKGTITLAEAQREIATDWRETR
jgi:hypothetical protein